MLKSVFVNLDRTKADECLALQELREQRRNTETLESTRGTTSSLRSTAPIFKPTSSSQEPVRLIPSIQLPHATDSTQLNFSDHYNSKTQIRRLAQKQISDASSLVI